MERKSFKGPISGLLCAAIGIVLVFINIAMIQGSGKYFPKLMALGFITLYMGIAVLIAPGSEDSQYGSDFKDAFYEANILTKIIWIIYFIAGLGAAIFVIFVKYTDYCKLLASITIAVSAALCLFKYIYFLLRKPKYDENGQMIVETPNYYHPAKSGAFAGVFVTALITLLSGYYSINKIHFMTYGINNFSDNDTNSVSINNYVESLIDTYVPVRLTNNYYNSDLIIEENPENDSEDNYMNLCYVPFNDIIKTFKQNNEDIYFNQIYFINEDKDINFEIDGKKFKKLKCIKNYLNNSDENIPSYFDTSKNNYCSKEDFFLSDEKNSDEFVVVNVPSYDEEFIMVWNLNTFTDFFNKNIAQLKEDDELYSQADILASYKDGAFEETGFAIISVKNFREYFFSEDEKESNFCIFYNFGFDNYITLENFTAYKYLHIEEESE